MGRCRQETRFRVENEMGPQLVLQESNTLKNADIGLKQLEF